MTAQQQDLARGLLKESLDWVGMDDLDEADELCAMDLQSRIERLLVDLEAPAELKPDNPEDLYRLVLSTRAEMQRAEYERDFSRNLMDERIKRSGREGLYLVRRFEVAYTHWQEAERLYERAEAEYYRSLSKEERK